MRNLSPITLRLHQKGFTLVKFCDKHNLKLGSFKQFVRGAFKSKKIENILKKEGIYE